MTGQTLDQARAAYTWECVQMGCDDKYVSLAKGAPALIMNSGLMQTLAYYQEKGKAHHRKLLDNLLHWLCDRGKGAVIDADADFPSAMRALYKGDSSTYRRATDEALALLRWIRQLAAASGSD